MCQAVSSLTDWALFDVLTSILSKCKNLMSNIWLLSSHSWCKAVLMTYRSPSISAKIFKVKLNRSFKLLLPDQMLHIQTMHVSPSQLWLKNGTKLPQIQAGQTASTKWLTLLPQIHKYCISEWWYSKNLFHSHTNLWHLQLQETTRQTCTNVVILYAYMYNWIHSSERFNFRITSAKHFWLLLNFLNQICPKSN